MIAFTWCASGLSIVSWNGWAIVFYNDRQQMFLITLNE